MSQDAILRLMLSFLQRYKGGKWLHDTIIVMGIGIAYHFCVLTGQTILVSPNSEAKIHHT